MTIDQLGSNIAALWLVAAVLLGTAELLVPGVFLIFLAIAAAAVGVATLALPELPLAVQLGAFGTWSVATVLIGHRWYRDYPVATRDPLLNDRARRMIGETVLVASAIVAGRGRVRVADGEWPATGPDAPVGTKMRIVAVRGGIVEVEPA